MISTRTSGWAARKPSIKGRQDVEHHGSRDVQLQPAAHARGRARRIVQGGAGFGKKRCNAPGERVSRISQPEAARRALEERDAELALQPGDGLAHRRRSHPLPTRRRPEAARLSDGEEDEEIVERRLIVRHAEQAIRPRPRLSMERRSIISGGKGDL
jgi:hypothetical protein